MRRALPLSLLALALPAAALASGRDDGRPSTPPPLAAKLTACDVGPNPADRSAGFEGSMPAQDGASTLGMRFDLQARTATKPFATVAAPTFGKWMTSDPGAAGYVFDKQVDALAADTQYRVEVRFRWKDADGKVVRTAQKVSAACRQPDERPDLAVTAIDVAAGADASQDAYTVTVANRGRGAVAMPFDVTLKPGSGGAPVTQSVPALDAGASVPLTFTAAACRSGASVRATADPDDQIDEPREGDDALVVTCPELH